MVLSRSTVYVEAPPAVVFAVYADVESWPTWTSSVTKVQRLDTGPLQVGSRARVRQPRLPTGDWTVTDVAPDRSFIWERRGPGLRTVGRHLLQPENSGCLVIAELEHLGLAAPLVAVLTKGLTQQYLRLETVGLKNRCEQIYER